MSSTSNLNNSSKNGNNNFRVSHNTNNAKRGMHNIFDGNKLAGSSTFNGLGNTQSKLGQSNGWQDNSVKNNQMMMGN